ncbi:MAG: serine/threonine-protein kinase RsbW [Acidimicrobiaceae bacterium]|nr:serine/threonine-protein kinase RsbW [Acidimicrobiaceae bacterium]MDQ1445973.1 serine/threonine-protein kinase RsbW [Acidimicrobiaceae bacterium]
MDPVIELEIPARAEYVGLARLVVSSLASGRRALPEERIDDLKLAVSEACTNAIEAHHEGDVEERVLVRCAEAEDRLEVSIQDRGKGFDPETLPEHPPVTDPERLNFERGLGIPLIRTLVDEVTFEPSSQGTAVRMVMYCDPALELDVDIDHIDHIDLTGLDEA